ncbi:MAG: hypothetical protein ACJAVE_000064 [Polaribacter sp.]|jgi:hypothetical protein|tara:strand:- start:196 stop:780 length:585 start_codon:yes stop_codon:yes gene_type:complete
MKKITFLFILTLISAQFTAQEKKENTESQDIGKNYELKINAFNLITFAALDLSYERLINEDSSFGMAVFYNFSDYADTDIAFPKKFSITPYYRWFFSENKYARGFFIEGFGMLNTYQDIYYNYDSYQSSSKIEKQTGFALGISVGGKFITKGGFTTEVLLGVGRNLIKGKSNDDYDFFENNIIGRFGISLGYRF